MSAIYRGYSEILAELDKLREEYRTLGGMRDRMVICEAIAWGYSTARTIRLLEKHLITADSYRPMVDGVARIWDGQGYLDGALSAAQCWGRRQGVYKVDLDEIPQERTAENSQYHLAEHVRPFVESGALFRLTFESFNAYVIETIGDRQWGLTVPKSALVLVD